MNGSQATGMRNFGDKTNRQPRIRPASKPPRAKARQLSSGQIRRGQGRKTMPSSYTLNFKEGSRSEILADYLFSQWGAVTPVRRQDDFGIDLYCTLFDRIGQSAVVRDYFSVQVKSTLDPWIFDGNEAV